MRQLIVVLAGALLFFSGCATTGQVTMPEPIQDSFVIDEPYDVVWKATVATFSEKSLPIKAIEKDSGLITTDFIIFANGLFADDKIKLVSNRPSILLGTWNMGRYSLSYYAVATDNNQTKIKITPHIEAFENNVSHNWHVCASKGILEKEIYEAIVAKLK